MPFLTHLDLLFLCTSDQRKKNFLENHPMNIPTKFRPIDPVVSEEEDLDVKLYR